MITLSSAISETRAILKWGGIVIGVIILIWLFFGLGSAIKNMFFPSPPPPPTVGFGKLEQISFPSQTEVKDLSFTIDTVTGSLPSFTDRAKVFKIKQPEANLLGLSKISEKLKPLGFISQPTPYGGSNFYGWDETEGIKRLISVDYVTNDFFLSSSYLLDKDIVSGKSFPDTANGILTAKEFLDSLGNYPSDLDEGKTKTKLFSIANSNITPASSVSNAQLMQVFFFQKDVDKLPIYYSKPNESTMMLMIAGGSYQGQIVQAKFNHQTISEIFETYPVKTAGVAFEELQKGKAYIASYQGSKKDIFIKKVSLGYYIGDEAQTYLMPIFVFEGNDNFVAYLPAVTDEWLNN